jgi:hypothetical protein
MWEWFFLDFSRRAGWGGQSRSLIDVRSITCNGRRKWLFTTTAWFRFFNLAPRYDLWSPEAKLSPRGELSPLGVKLSPGGETLCSPLHSFEQWRVFTPGGERRGEHFPRGQSSPLGGYINYFCVCFVCPNSRRTGFHECHWSRFCQYYVSNRIQTSLFLCLIHNQGDQMSLWKNRPNPIFFKIDTELLMKNKVAQKFGIFVQFSKTPPSRNNHPLGENSPILVTLFTTHALPDFLSFRSVEKFCSIFYIFCLSTHIVSTENIPTTDSRLAKCL